MSASNLAVMRSMSFSIVVFMLLTVGTGNAAFGDRDDHRGASGLHMTTNPASNQPQAMPTACLPDGNEPNDNPSQATPVVSTSTMEVNFHSSTDVDWYRYSVTGGSWHVARISGSRVPLVMQVFIASTGQSVVEGESRWEWWNGSYTTEAWWFAASSADYLVEVTFPGSASGLHTCTVGQYPFSIQPSTLLPTNGQFQLDGLVFHDSNWSGGWEIGEPPIESAIVRLLRPGGTVVATQSTNHEGVFHFMDVAPGQYVVEQTDLNGYVSTTSNQVIIALSRDTLMYFGDYHLPSRSNLQFLPLQMKQQ